jgi:hypothetical protein
VETAQQQFAAAGTRQQQFLPVLRLRHSGLPQMKLTPPPYDTPILWSSGSSPKHRLQRSMAQKCVASKRVLNCVPRMQIISCSVARNEVLLDSFNEIYQHGMLFEDVYKRLPTTLRVKKSLMKNAFYRYKNKQCASSAKTLFPSSAYRKKCASIYQEGESNAL